MKYPIGRWAAAGCLLLFVLLSAPVSRAQKVGTTSMQFLKVAPTARGVSMGESFVSLAEGSSAAYWNPAGLVATEGQSLAFDRVNYFMDVAHNALSYGINLGSWGAVGAHFYMTDGGEEIQETRVDELGFQGDTYNPGLTGNTFQVWSWVAGVSYARRFTDRFSAGLTAKYAREDLWKAQAGVPLFDFGMRYDTGFRSLQLGASVLNFGPSVKFVEESYPAPMTFRIGASANLIGETGLAPVRSEYNRLTVSYDLIEPNDYDQQWTTGLEYTLMERFSLRGGYLHNFDTRSYSLGAGIRQPIGTIDLMFDYAYSGREGALQPVHRFSLRANIK